MTANIDLTNQKEEAGEYLAEESKEELADSIEVVEALVQSRGLLFSNCNTLKNKKRQQKAALKKEYFYKQ